MTALFETVRENTPLNCLNTVDFSVFSNVLICTALFQHRGFGNFKPVLWGSAGGNKVFFVCFFFIKGLC